MDCDVELAYDDRGNIIRFKKGNNYPVYLLWAKYSYFPVVKIISPGDITIPQALRTSIFNDENIYSDDYFYLNIDGLRNNVANAIGNTNCMIYTYTFKRAEGITSETDPNGITTYYKYDALGRLLYVADKDGNILTSYDYHYKD